MAECVQDHGRAIGVEISKTLNTVETYGQQQQETQAMEEWPAAVSGMHPELEA